MSSHVLANFTPCFQKWVGEESPHPVWQCLVLDWIDALNDYVYDDSVRDLWRGQAAWLGLVRVDGNTEEVIEILYDVRSGGSEATCRWIRRVPFYDPEGEARRNDPPDYDGGDW